LTGARLRRSLRNVQRDAIRGPPPLGAEGKGLVRGKEPNEVTRQGRQALRLLPGFELSEVTHASNLSHAGCLIVVVFAPPGSFPRTTQYPTTLHPATPNPITPHPAPLHPTTPHPAPLHPTPLHPSACQERGQPDELRIRRRLGREHPLKRQRGHLALHERGKDARLARDQALQGGGGGAAGEQAGECARPVSSTRDVNPSWRVV